jgi:hypothetical protein
MAATGGRRSASPQAAPERAGEVPGLAGGCCRVRAPSARSRTGGKSIGPRWYTSSRLPVRGRLSGWRPRGRDGQARPRPSWRLRTRRRSWNGCERRSPSRRSSCTCSGEKEAGTDRRPGPCACGCRHQARAARPGRPRRRVRLVGPPRLQRARDRRGAGGPLDGASRRGPVARGRAAGAGRGAARATGLGARRDRGAVRGVGSGRPFAPQARSPRVAAWGGVRVRIDRSAGATGREPGVACHAPA